MIQSFADSETQALWLTGKSRRFPADLVRTALRKLLMLHGAGTLSDLRALPGNRLEPLRGDRKGQHSIRINDRYRICFAWKHDGAHEVEITDYH
ncbi:MAG: type II toxin-antitoxin system RelE/ParE family toxin [Acidobacteriia bacterium]|nr:type II toxin-antitoxin system RelE/ParE family toxin [Terriglobia bacterium]